MINRMVKPLALLGEGLGTFALVMAMMASGGGAIVVGLTLAAIIFLIGGVSGAHVNPAISIAMFYNGSLSMMDLAAYIVVQLVGAFGAVMLYNGTRA